MGCACATAKRRRSQAANGYRHIHAKARPTYKKRAADVSQKRLQRLIENERRMKQGKNK
jgi:hypothetical protein